MRRRALLLGVLSAMTIPVAISAQTKDESDVRMVVAAFGKALASGDSTAAIALLHPEVAIFEGGWETLEDYRRGHLRADMRALQALKQETLRDVIKVSGDLALSTREYSSTGTIGERKVDSVGVETMVLLRTGEGWKIRHIHWSSRARRPAGNGGHP